ncbi:hypothetical protein [Tessaracoccus coleopterorum]|nr:hypothetical protein [Tessaracoccus coleopterorum]
MSALTRRTTTERLARGEGIAFDADGRGRGDAVTRKGIIVRGVASPSPHD